MTVVDVVIQVYTEWGDDDEIEWLWRVDRDGRSLTGDSARSVEEALCAAHAATVRTGAVSTGPGNPRSRELASVMGTIGLKAALGTTDTERGVLALRRALYAVAENLEIEAARLNLPPRILQREISDALFRLAGPRLEHNSPATVARRLQRFFDPRDTETG